MLKGTRTNINNSNNNRNNKELFAKSITICGMLFAVAEKPSKKSGITT